MDRLTARDGTGQVMYKTDASLSEILEKLGHYEDLEEQSRLIELPCKLYEPVYELSTKYKSGKKVYCGIHESRFYYDHYDFHNRKLRDGVFLEIEEAEAALITDAFAYFETE